MLLKVAANLLVSFTTRQTCRPSRAHGRRFRRGTSHVAVVTCGKPAGLGPVYEFCGKPMLREELRATQVQNTEQSGKRGWRRSKQACKSMRYHRRFDMQ